jgi:hypothetical protein
MPFFEEPPLTGRLFLGKVRPAPALTGMPNALPKSGGLLYVIGLGRVALLEAFGR